MDQQIKRKQREQHNLNSNVRFQIRRTPTSWCRKHWSPRVQWLAPTQLRPTPQPNQRGRNQTSATIQKKRWTESQSELRHQTRRTTVSCSRKHWSTRVQRLAPTLLRPMPQPNQRGHNRPFATVRIEIPNIGEGRGACKFSGTNNQPPPAP